jgi:hypothetical protein
MCQNRVGILPQDKNSLDLARLTVYGILSVNQLVKETFATRRDSEDTCNQNS